MSEAAAPPEVAEEEPVEVPEPGAALARRDGPAAWLDRPIIDQIDKRQLEVIRRTVAAGATNAELAMYLEIAASLDLNPFMHEIWCAISEGRDGGRRQVLIMVGRDGLLKVARREDDYLGYDSAVVWEKDVYERVAPDADGKTLRERAGVVHTSTGFAGTEGRGQIVGAWCAVERAGRPPRVFEAPLSEYLPRSEKKLKYSPWGSAISVMIEKCALSVAHRTSFDLSGVLGEGEEHRALESGGDGNVTLEPAEALREAVDALDVETDLKREVFEAALAVNELERDLWNPARIQMTLMGQPEERVRAALAEMTEELARLREAAEAEEPPEAEVVEDVADPEPDPDPAVKERVAALQFRRNDLVESMQAEEPGSEAFGAYSAELDQVDAELESLALDAEE